MNKEIRLYLIELARIKRTVSYAKAMSQFGLNASNPTEVDYFANEIGEISEHEHLFKRPMLSSLVVHSSKNSIGFGFYRLAEKLGYDKKEVLSKQHFERQMQELCYEIWSDDKVYFQETGKKASSKAITNYSLYLNDEPQEGIGELPERKFDFSGYDIDWNQKYLSDLECGNIGEDLVLEYEKRVLIDNGFPELIERVRKVKDGNGFDILSVNFDGSPKYIEVKTTKGGSATPFQISLNEVKFSEMNATNYYLYRLYNLNMENKTADFFEYQGSVTDNFLLESIHFEAYKKK
ncbi:DUF3883 domain-containing protein [Sphingobacterium psychroaquaticum]|uniref:Protein NO VEIN C-terminal domain-containing protein n=1 Tax=Sphingobacterium psychroaquaticum TaxID=561061 RepID=A0A1X7IMK7_9SPHI|nr:DUF3883 domain-containing protein [Sphingobacterium psychroaquaticum]SMG15585.1 protein of unknown function [Sphingobacterium psychroaquaticum]